MAMKENDELGATLRDLAKDSCVALFEAYRVPLERSTRDWGEIESRMLCGVLGFVGSGVRGTTVLAGTEASIAASCPSGGRLRDWVGELTNQLGGRLKSKLLARQAEVALATPIVLSGVQLKPLIRSNDHRPLVLEMKGSGDQAGGAVMVWVEVESDDRFQLGPEKPAAKFDGEILLF